MNVGLPSIPPVAAWSDGPTPRQIAHQARREALAESALRWGLLGMSCLFVNCFIFAFVAHFGSDSANAIAVAAGIGMVGLFGFALAGVAAEATFEERRDLPPEAHLAQVTVIQDNVITGADRGYFCIQNGLLTFKGKRTAFALQSSSVEIAPQRKPENLGLPGDAKFIRLGHPTRTVFIAYAPLSAPNGNSDPRYETHRFVSEWYQANRPSPVAPVYPPLSRDPKLASWLDRTETKAAACGVFILVIASFIFGSPNPLLACLPVLYIHLLRFIKRSYKSKRLFAVLTAERAYIAQIAKQVGLETTRAAQVVEA